MGSQSGMDTWRTNRKRSPRAHKTSSNGCRSTWACRSTGSWNALMDSSTRSQNALMDSSTGSRNALTGSSSGSQLGWTLEAREQISEAPEGAATSRNIPCPGCILGSTFILQIGTMAGLGSSSSLSLSDPKLKSHIHCTSYWAPSPHLHSPSVPF